MASESIQTPIKKMVGLFGGKNVGKTTAAALLAGISEISIYNSNSDNSYYIHNDIYRSSFFMMIKLLICYFFTILIFGLQSSLQEILVHYLI